MMPPDLDIRPYEHRDAADMALIAAGRTVNGLTAAQDRHALLAEVRRLRGIREQRSTVQSVIDDDHEFRASVARLHDLMPKPEPPADNTGWQFDTVGPA